MGVRRVTLMAVCQLAGISAAALILPCSLIDLAFDTDFLNTERKVCPSPGAGIVLCDRWRTPLVGADDQAE